MKSKRRALLRALLFAAIAMVSASALAFAETAKARRTANVYVSRGERSKVATTVRSGKTVQIISRKGRWLRVKVNGKVGWIVRSNIAASAKARKKDPNNRRRAFVSGRSRKRDLRRKSAPRDRYGLDATGGSGDDDIVLEDDGSTQPKKSRAKKKSKKSKKSRSKKSKNKKKSKKSKKSAKNDDDDEEGFDIDDEDLDDDPDDLVAGDDDGDDDDDDGDDDDDDDDVDRGPEFVVATADVDLREGKKKSSEEVSFAEPGEKLQVVERDGDWVKVQTTDGEVGWVPSDKVRGEGERSGKLLFLVRGALGAQFMSQSFTSDDTASTFGNYDIGARAAKLGAAGEIWYDYSKDYWLAGELDLGYTVSTPGIRVEEGMNAADTGFSILDVAAVAKGGYKLHQGTGTVAFLRLGYSYHAFQIKNVLDIMNTNLAALPSENLTSPVVGVELAVPDLTKTVAARLVVDTMLIGASRSQTGGLEDGQVSSAKAADVSAEVTWDYKPNLTLLFGLDYEWASTTWAGVANSQRKHNAENAARSDTAYILNVGVSKGF